VNGFIDLLYTPFGSIRNYSATANIHNSQITTAFAKSSQFAFTSCFLVTYLNIEDSSVSRPHVVAIRRIFRKSTLSLTNQLLHFTQLKSRSYVTTDGQSASLSWNKALIWGLRPDIYYCQDSCGFVDVGRSL
jgi:hypothetical protein